MAKDKTPVRLRQRKTSSGNISLYLDIYLDGKRNYEYLKLYLVPEKTPADKEVNRQTLQLAKAIQAKRLVEVQNHEYGFKDGYAENTNFYNYYVAMCESRLGEDTKGNWGNWKSALAHLAIYDNKLKKRTFAEIDHDWILGFKEYLQKRAVHTTSDTFKFTMRGKRLANNSQVSYFNKLRACINQAFEERIIMSNPLRGIDSISGEPGTRMYLTFEELKTLVNTPCNYPNVRRAFLFSCLTGLRRSDIVKMTWGEIHQQGEFTRIIFKQKKTGHLEYLDITPEAVELMGERGKDSDLVFGDIMTPSNTNAVIKTWCARAGINKDITFHCGRHTFATMMLDLGTDIYTVSKLLGHTQLSTTQIYAKVLDKNKQAAVTRIPSILPTTKPAESETPPTDSE